jgi:hypothetical protein
VRFLSFFSLLSFLFNSHSSLPSFDASVGWGHVGTELDYLDIFSANVGEAAGPSRSAASRSGYETPSMDWLKLLGAANVFESERPAVATSMPLVNSVDGGMGGGASAGGPSSTTATATTGPSYSFSSILTRKFGPFSDPVVPPSTSTAQALSPAVAAVASVEAESLATPSDGGGPEATANPWPHVYEPAGRADALSLPSVPNPPPLLLFENPGDAVSPETREAMMQFVSDSHSSPSFQISLASFPSAAVLSACIKLYVSRFHDTVRCIPATRVCLRFRRTDLPIVDVVVVVSQFPILDADAVAAGTVAPHLLLACAAVGAMYRPEFEGLGVALTELVRRISLYKVRVNTFSFTSPEQH